jgi:hypothetical protein
VIELLFLVFFLPKRIGILARERDRSAFWRRSGHGWGVECLIIFVWVVLATTGSLVWGWPEDVERSSITLVVYFIALFGGMVGADIVRRRLTAKPVIREVKQWKGIWG